MSCRNEISAICFYFEAYKYNYTMDDVVQAKHVAIWILCNKELCIEGLYPY
jgi:hypothetical protein